MEASCRAAILVAVLLSLGANYRTENFIVTAGTPALAKQVGDEAERLRQALANHWLGRELPAWPAPCPIEVFAGPNIPAHGQTTYTPDGRTVRDFVMEIHGTPQRLLDSVLPHEVTHTVLATHFGRPLPRWADEGACTTVEHAEERQNHERMLREFLMTRRGIAMNTMFMMRDYPPDMLPLYAQGYSVSRFLIAHGGHQSFVKFLEDYFRMRKPSWTEVVRNHYGYNSLAELQDAWLEWVRKGSSEEELKITLAARQNRGGRQVAVAPVGYEAAANVASTAPASAVQTADDDGWYSRRRQQIMAREETNASIRR